MRDLWILNKSGQILGVSIALSFYLTPKMPPFQFSSCLFQYSLHLTFLLLTPPVTIPTSHSDPSHSPLMMSVIFPLTVRYICPLNPLNPPYYLAVQVCGLQHGYRDGHLVTLLGSFFYPLNPQHQIGGKENEMGKGEGVRLSPVNLWCLLQFLLLAYTFLRNCEIDFQSGSTSLYSHQQ